MVSGVPLAAEGGRAGSYAASSRPVALRIQPLPSRVGATAFPPDPPNEGRSREGGFHSPYAIDSPERRS